MANRYSYKATASLLRGTDDQRLFVNRRDASGGQNTRQNGALLGETQFTELYNYDISIPGQRFKRLGSTQTADSVSSNAVSALFSADSKLVMVEGTNVRYWTGSGNWGSPIYTSISGTDVGVLLAKESGLAPDDVVIVQDGANNAQRADLSGNIQDLGNTNTSPPKTTVMSWYANRIWALKDTLLYWSDAYASDYATAFDRSTNAFRIPVGDERMLVASRNQGLVVGGADGIWSILPSATPTATDRPEPLLPDYGVVSKRGWCLAGDDLYFFSRDGFRALNRTVQDKLQMSTSYPISYSLKDEFEEIDWTRIEELSMVYFDNKILISVPVGRGFKVWCYYIALNTMTVWEGWNPSCWAVYRVSGENRLYYGSADSGVVYRALYGFTDEGTSTTNGTKITMREQGRKEDMGQKFVYKNGAEVEVRAIASGDYTLSAYIQLDDAGYNLLGTINVAGNFLTFPITFPAVFLPANIVNEKFHFDQYGRWRECQVKLEHDATNGNDQITVLETNIFAYPESYGEEE